MRVLQSVPLRTILETTERRGDLIPGLMPADGITLLTAPPKIGKTMFACQAALAALEGRSFLGFPTGPAVNVLYCDNESSNDELKQRFDMLQSDARDPYALQFCRDHFQLAKDDDVDGLIEIVAVGGHKLVIIDTLATYMLGVDENDAGSVSRPLHGLRRLQQETGAVFKTTAIFISALIHDGGVELVEQVSVCSVNFNDIKTNSDCALSSCCKISNESCNFLLC